MIELVSDSLPGVEIESGLIESPPQPLPILRDEAGRQTPGHDSARQKQAIEQSA
jgi:hypothetical protein